MEYLDKSVEEYIESIYKANKHELDNAIIDASTQMLEALLQVHKFDTLHNDVKPENFRYSSEK